MSDDTFLVGTVGRLHPSTGMDLLIPALRAGAPAFVAPVILGEGPQRADLKRLWADDSRIHLSSYCADVYPCLQDLDLFDLSREEYFGCHSRRP